MSSRQTLVDPEVARVLQALAGPSVPDSLEAARRSSPAMAELKGPPERVHSVTDLSIEGPGGPLGLRHYQPDVDDPPLLVYLHGGGWVIGDLDIQDGLCRALANRARCGVLSVDYRLAPEHPFPAALDDARAALSWAESHFESVGLRGQLGVAGDSAGGNLAAALALGARDESGPDLALCVLICPITDHRETDGSLSAFAEGFFLGSERLAWYWDQYAPPGVDRSTPDLSPLRTDPAGLCPTVVVTAGLDPLRDQAVDFVRACCEAGVETVLLHHPWAIHGFLGFQASLPRSRQALDELASVVRGRFELARLRQS